MEREQRQQQTGTRKINDLPADMIHEIFDKNPKAGLVLANTNKWFSEVLKYKIKKHRQLIRECNSASISYGRCFNKIFAKECEEAWEHRYSVISSYACYLHCVNCFYSFEHVFFTFYFLVRIFDQVYETGIVLCNKCALKYHGETIEEIIKAQDSDDDSNHSGSLDF